MEEAIKALTLTQPWASLVALGAKKIETRSWSTSYRGPLAIHAAKGFPKAAKALCFTEPFLSSLCAHWADRPCQELADDTLPRGMVLATCTLLHVVQIGPRPIPTGHSYEGPWVNVPPGEPERSFGDYTPGRFAWILSDVRPLAAPVLAKGALGLWEWTPPNGLDGPGEM